jgi:hypothetical protein
LSAGPVEVPLPNVFCWYLGKCEFFHSTAYYIIPPGLDVTILWYPAEEDKVQLIFSVSFGKPRNYATGEVLYSVPGYSPTAVKFPDGSIDIIPMEDLWYMIDSPVECKPMADGNVAEVKYINNGIRIPDGEQDGVTTFIPLRKIVRHRYSGELVRVMTAHGVVDVSPNHSIVLHQSHKPIDAKSLKIGDPVSINISIPKPYYSPFFAGSKDLAWLLGYFTADGTAYMRHDGNVDVAFPNNEYVDKVRDVMREHLHREETALTSHYLGYSDRPLYEWFRNNCYTRAGDKRVPKAILNAPKEVKLAFLEGYNAGDGTKKKGKVKYHFKGFTSKSQTLLQGVIALMLDTTGQDFRIYGNSTRENVFQLNLLRRRFQHPSRWLEPVKKVYTVPFITESQGVHYEPYLYDLVTDNHTFLAGVGQIRTHNTDEIGFWHRGKGMKLHWDPLVESITGIVYPHITPATKEEPFEIRFVNRTANVTAIMDVSVWVFEYHKRDYQDFMEMVGGFAKLFRLIDRVVGLEPGEVERIRRALGLGPGPSPGAGG